MLLLLLWLLQQQGQECRQVRLLLHELWLRRLGHEK